jgi:hypothetical protein
MSFDSAWAPSPKATEPYPIDIGATLGGPAFSAYHFVLEIPDITLTAEAILPVPLKIIVPALYV